MSPIELCWNITSYISIIVQLIAAGVCFGVFVLPYMQGRDKAVKTGSVYGVVMTVLYFLIKRYREYIIPRYFRGLEVQSMIMLWQGLKSRFIDRDIRDIAKYGIAFYGKKVEIAM